MPRIEGVGQGVGIAMKKRVLVYAVPVPLMYSWPDVAIGAGYSVQVNADEYVVDVPGLAADGPTACRSGTVCRGGVSVTVAPSGGSHVKSKSRVAGKRLILIFYSEKWRPKEASAESVLAAEIGSLLVTAGATAVPPRNAPPGEGS